jgi:hypothetical protein
MPNQRRLLANRKLCQLITHDEKSLHDATEPGGMHDNSVGGSGSRQAGYAAPHRDAAAKSDVQTSAGIWAEMGSIWAGTFVRYHACIEWKNDQCQLLGRGYYPADERRWHPSACGVWLDGKRMPAGGELVFSPGREYRVTLAEAEAEKPAAYELSVRLAALLPVGVTQVKG